MAPREPDLPLSVAEYLDEVAAFLAVPNQWTQHSMARDQHNFHVPIDSQEATCWCLAGALTKNGLNRSEPSIAIAYEAVTRVLNGRPIVQFNDTKGRTQDEVVAKVRKAADRVRERWARYTAKTLEMGNSL